MILKNGLAFTIFVQILRTKTQYGKKKKKRIC